MFEPYMLQIAAVALVVVCWTAAQIWVRHGQEEDRRRSEAIRSLPRQQSSGPIVTEWSAGIPGYEDPRHIGRR